MIYDGTLLESIEGIESLDDPPSVAVSGQIWQRLEDEKVELTENLFNEEPLVHDQLSASPETDLSDEVSREIEWNHRVILECRLRDITEAQDRLMEGMYGQCRDCGELIDRQRLAADAAAARCLSCQSVIDEKHRFCSL